MTRNWSLIVLLTYSVVFYIWAHADAWNSRNRQRIADRRRLWQMNNSDFTAPFQGMMKRRWEGLKRQSGDRTQVAREKRRKWNYRIIYFSTHETRIKLNHPSPTSQKNVHPSKKINFLFIPTCYSCCSNRLTLNCLSSILKRNIFKFLYAAWE